MIDVTCRCDECDSPLDFSVSYESDSITIGLERCTCEDDNKYQAGFEAGLEEPNEFSYDAGYSDGHDDGYIDGQESVNSFITLKEKAQ